MKSTPNHLHWERLHCTFYGHRRQTPLTLEIIMTFTIRSKTPWSFVQECFLILERSFHRTLRFWDADFIDFPILVHFYFWSSNCKTTGTARRWFEQLTIIKNFVIDSGQKAQDSFAFILKWLLLNIPVTRDGETIQLIKTQSRNYQEGEALWQPAWWTDRERSSMCRLFFLFVYSLL